MSETSSDLVRSGDARFVVIEGIDGSGSTSQGQDLVEAFREHRPIVFTREPSTGPVGMLIRLALAGRLKGPVANGLNRSGEGSAGSAGEVDPTTMALLFAADRQDHVSAEIAPNLAQGRTVVSDRYLLSTLAYQGLGLDLEWLLAINEKAVKPDLTIFLDVDVERARARIEATRWTEDIYESVVQQRRVRQNYHDVIGRRLPILGPIVTVDASRPRDVVFGHLQEILTRFFDTGTIGVEPHPEAGRRG